MDNIGKHMEFQLMLDKIASEKECDESRKLIMKEHEAAILDGYRAMEKEAEDVFERHFQGILDNDKRVEVETATSEGRTITSDLLLFTLFTSPYFAARMESLVIKWILKKIGKIGNL